MQVMRKRFADWTLNMSIPIFLAITLLGSAVVAALILYAAS